VVSEILETVAPRLLGPALMVAAALIVRGYADVGDGFSAGVIVALAVALRYVVLGQEHAERDLPILRRAPMAIALGLLIAIVSGFFGIALGDPPFTHLPPPGDPVVKIGKLELITAVAFDIGLMLAVVGSLVMLMHHLAGLVAGRRA
jgi:multisubunit Na+/H+ antiporter MnhB subunit